MVACVRCLKILSIASVQGLLRFFALVGLACVVHTAMAERDPLNEPVFTSIGDTRSINDGVVTALAQDERGLIWPVGAGQTTIVRRAR